MYSSVVMLSELLTAIVAVVGNLADVNSNLTSVSSVDTVSQSDVDH